MPTAYNPISLGQVQTEFTGTNPIGINEYYRGGGYTTENNTNVPTSGTISLAHFYSAYRAYQVPMDFTRDADYTNYFYLNSPGFPQIEITTPVNGGGSTITYYIPTNVNYIITSNAGTSIRQNGNGMQLEDGVDTDYNDLEWYPQSGTVYESGGNFYYILNI